MIPFHLPLSTSRCTYLLSVISYLLFAFANPAFAWDDDDFDSSHNHTSTRRQSSIVDFSNPKSSDNLDSTIQLQPITRPKLETIQESIDRQNNELRKISAESQRQFEEHKARRDASYAKQNALNDEFDRQQCEMKEFVGGVYKAEFGTITGRNSAVTTEGYIYRSGNVFVTPRGIYSKDGNVYAGPDGITVKSGGLFYGAGGTTIQSGGAFFTEGNSGYIVGPNCFNKAAWRSR